jgi:phage terminase large subunit-like protein
MGVSVTYKAVSATRGKAVRAQPIAALYEQHRVVHCGAFDELESELVTWTPDSGQSPNRLDALVWALTELLVREQRQVYVY